MPPLRVLPAMAELVIKRMAFAEEAAGEAVLIMTRLHKPGALPPAPESAGAPDMRFSQEDLIPGARRCPNGGAALHEPPQRDCDAAGGGRETTKTGKPARGCATLGCAEKVEGKSVYCAACRRAHRRAYKRGYRKREEYVDPLPPGPPTSMDWLKRFSGWTKSGLSYGAYQAAERTKRRK